MKTCNACGKPNGDERYKACEKCRAGWRLDKGLTYQKKTITMEEHQIQVMKLRAVIGELVEALKPMMQETMMVYEVNQRGKRIPLGEKQTKRAYEISQLITKASAVMNKQVKETNHANQSA